MKENNNERYYYKENTNVYLKFRYNENIVKDVKTIPNRVWNNYNKYWIIEETLRNRRAIALLISKYEFSLKNFKTKSIEEFPKFDNKNLPSILYNYMEDFDELGLKQSPRDYQELAINYALTKKKFINGLDMGLGKTLSTIFAAELGCLFPFIVICPASVKYHWKNSWVGANPNRNISVIETGKNEKNNDWTADVIIINYDILGSKEVKKKNDIIISKKIVSRFSELLTIKFEGMAIDEIHFCKSGTSIRTKMVKKIAKGCEYIWGLTGTLVMNRPSELINPITILGRFTELFGNWNNFVFTYCDAKRTRFGLDTSGASNINKLNYVLRNSCYLRMEKQEVLKSLPEVQSTIFFTELSNQRKYLKAEGEFIEYMTANYTQEKVDSAKKAEFLVMRNELTKLCIEGKIKSIIEWLKDYKETTSDKLIIFGRHREAIEKLSKTFKSKAIIGGVSSEKKQQIVDGFATSNDQFLFLNINSGSTGVDGLQKSCSNMLFIELPDVPTVLQQAVARLDRSGQKNNVSVYYLFGKNSIDEHIKGVLDEKLKIVDAINKGINIGEIKGFDEMLIESYIKK